MKKGMSETPHVETDPEEREAWRWADTQLTSWGRPQNYDYDFFKSCKWTKGASNDLLNAGCLYEYARESHKYRCWLVLRRAPTRDRFWLPRLIGLEFERNSDGSVRNAGHNHLFMSGWGRWLDKFALDLIANKSFEKVFRANSSRVLKSLDKVDTYSFYPNAVELPGSSTQQLYPGSQDVLIRINWRLYDNGQIGEEMERLARDARPKGAKEPKKKRVRSDLKALSVLRIQKLQKHNPWERLKLVAEVCRYKLCKKEAEAYKERGKRGHATEWMSGKAKSRISKARHRALSLFGWWFPWGKPSNY
jgi:hypothetical protein